MKKRRSEPPMRTCIGCRSVKPKEMLIRMVRDDIRRVIVDKKKLMPGRGEYICPDEGCIRTALKKRRLSAEDAAYLTGELLG